MEEKKFIEQHINKIIKEFDFENQKLKNSNECICFKENKKCHDISEMNCFFCYCPEYDNSKIEGGCKINSKNGKWFFADGKKIWDCGDCEYPHKEEIVRKYLRRLFSAE